MGSLIVLFDLVVRSHLVSYNNFIIPPPLPTKFCGVYIGINPSVRPFIVQLLLRHLDGGTDIGETVAVYDFKICMKEDNPDSTYIKRDNSREIIIYAGQGLSFVI